MVADMLNPVNAHDPIAIGRLLEFLSPHPSWHRSLWSIGLILGLSELHEACTACRAGILSDASVRRICSALMRKAGKDPALEDHEKAFLRAQVGKEPPRADGPAHHVVAEMAARLDKDYLKRWARVVTRSGFTVENFSRSVASHLLDAGFSASHLHALIKKRLGSVTPITLADICDELHAEVQNSPCRPFEVLLAFAKPPRMAGGIPPTWLDAKGVSGWLLENGFDTTHVRASVGLILVVHARDGASAARAAREESDRFAARAVIATGAPLVRLPLLWVKGDREPVAQDGDSRGVRVKALYRENLIFSRSEGRSVDAALELLAHLEGSSPTAAIAGGWGAMEGLLASPGDRATAADNLAALVTCSFPRAELTALSYKAEEQHGDAAAKLRACGTNRERAGAMAQMIHDGTLADLNGTADRAAVMRVRKLLADPSPELQTIKETIAEAFHRLYRQRNLILHGGKLDGVTLTASLRTVARLAGAGMDRITHGQYVQGLRPLELVARADLSIALITRQHALSCVDLLEPQLS